MLRGEEGAQHAFLQAKGPTESTDSFRGLLMGDHTAKVCTSVLAPEVKKAIDTFSHLSNVEIHEEEQRTEVAMLFPPLFYARKHKTPSAIMFIVLSKAFDKLVRQVVFGASEAHGDINTITDTLLRSGVDMVAASHLAPIVASSGLEVLALICNMVGRLHDQTWFQIDSKRMLIMTTRGSRQGSVIFNAVTVSPCLSF